MFTNTLVKALQNIWPMLVIFLVVIVMVRISYLLINGEKIVWHKEIFTFLFVVYALLLFELVTNTESASRGVNLVPFREILRYKTGSKLFMYNVVGNILVFLPFGYFVSSYVKAKKLSHIFFIAIITSLTIELVQLNIGRAFDIDDILLNVVGAIAGFLLYIGLTAIKKHLPGIFQRDFLYNILSIILLICVILYFLKIMGFWWFA